MSSHMEDLVWQERLGNAQAEGCPSVIHRPRLFLDGDQWCALLGENIQTGVVGFGDSPYTAMQAFDLAWYEKIPTPEQTAAPDTEGEE